MIKIFDSEDISFLERQEKFLKDIISSIMKTPKTFSVDLAQIEQTISFLKDEMKSAKEEDMPALFQQLEQQYSIAQKFSKPVELPDTSAPYFAHMRLLENGRERDIFLGHVSFIPRDSNFKIVDWRSAPISQVYYNFREGEDFELDLPTRVIEGIVKEKNILTIRNGNLVRVDKGKKSFIRTEDCWEILDKSISCLEGGQGKAVREIALGTGMTNYEVPDVMSLLDKKQFSLLSKDDQSSLLVIGGAGSGKTTVALHRLAGLCYRKKYAPSSMLSIVPHRGLVRLSRNLLSNIGLNRVKVTTGKDWFKNQAWNIISDLPKKVCEFTPPGVSLLKRHRSILDILDIYVQRKEETILRQFNEKGCSEISKKFLEMKTVPLVPRLETIRDLSDLSPTEKIMVGDFLKEVENFNSAREDIFKDVKLLLQMIELSGGRITSRNVEETIRHTAYQFKAREYDSDYKDRTLDGRSMDYGTPDELRGTIDYEDFPILLHLIGLLRGDISTRKGSGRKYNHVVLDEAQELAPIDLSVFGKCLLNKEGSFTVSGDSAQQIDETASFTGWKDVFKYLGEDDMEAHELNISYRSPQSVVEFAYKILGPIAPAHPPRGNSEGKPVIRTISQHRAHASMMINEALDDLFGREPNASVAVICNKFETAREFYMELKNLPHVRHVEDGDFSFRPGIDVTTV